MTQPNDNLRERLANCIGDHATRPSRHAKCFDGTCNHYRVADSIIPLITQACNDARLDEHKLYCPVCEVSMDSYALEHCTRRKQLEEGK